jgi:hypothetical protein
MNIGVPAMRASSTNGIRLPAGGSASTAQRESAQALYAAFAP